jgi:uncharacterized beta-barrel protein YwiB (DUF1934 family)
MKNNVMLTIRGQQFYQDQDPEIIELVTEGSMVATAKGWQISYEESDLTGLNGVTTIFDVEQDTIILTRKGPLSSQMVFQKGVLHESLYQMEFGALMITVCATSIGWDISENGGIVDLQYNIEIEQTAMGVVTYHLDIAPME